MNIIWKGAHNKTGVLSVTNHYMFMLLKQILKLIYQGNSPEDLSNLCGALEQANTKTIIKRKDCENLDKFLQDVIDNQIDLIINNADVKDLTVVGSNLLNNLRNLIKLSAPSTNTTHAYNQNTPYNNDKNYINRLENTVNTFVTAIAKPSTSTNPTAIAQPSISTKPTKPTV